MRVLDLFSGLGGFSEPFRDRGHEVITLDIDARFKPDVVADVRKIRYPSLNLSGEFDVVLASPPCNMFSKARAFHGWPWKETADALALVTCAFRLIAEIHPRWHVVENPEGRLRMFIGPPKQTVHLCDYGSKWQKPTDLWGDYPGELPNPNRCAPHESSPNYRLVMKKVRDPALRAKLPYGLGEELCKRMEAKIEVTV